MAGRGISAPAVALAGVGGVAVYAALKGVSLSSGLRTLLSGKAITGPGISATIGTGPIGGLAGAASALGSSGETGVVAAAGRYVGSGTRYLWGGGSPSGWDCSGYVNYVLCHDLGLPIPGYAGGAFTGSGHGPVTSQWAVWSGCVTVPRNQCQAGDIVVWPLQHMGIAIDNNTMVNCPGPNGALNPIITRIDGEVSGPLAGTLLIRRLLVQGG